jgi:DNA primase
LLTLGFSPQQIAQAGLVHRADNGQTRDLFRARLMIPIRNSQGELGGFGGRSLDGSSPKYLNSPRTPVFDKGRILYALHLAKDAASRNGIVVVEGYMDAMMAHQHGFNNVVASMGTALTGYQVDAIRRLTSSVVMALDADAAGQQATEHNLESSWKVLHTQVAGQAQGVTLYLRQELPEIKVAKLPEGLDPDEVIQRSPDEWAQLVENAVPLFDYLLNYWSSQVDISTPQGKAWVVERAFQLIAAAPEPTRQDHYFQALAARLGVTQETLRATIGRPSPVRRDRANQPRSATPSPFAKLDHDPLEEHCLALLLRDAAAYEGAYEAAKELRPEYFRRLENREIFNQWLRVCQDGEEGPPLTLLRANIDAELTEHLESLVQKALPPLSQQRRQVAFRDTVSRLEERHLRELKAEEEIKFASAPTEPPEESHLEVLEVNRRIKRNQETRGSVAPQVSQRGL